MRNELKTFWSAFKAKPFDYLLLAAIFIVVAYFINLAYGVPWFISAMGAIIALGLSAAVCKILHILWDVIKARRAKTEPLRQAAFQRKLNAANAEVELEEHLGRRYIPLFKGMTVSILVAFALATLASVAGSGNGYFEVLVSPNWLTITIAVLITCGLGMFQFTYWKMFLASVQQQGWRGFMKYIMFFPVFLMLVLPASTFFMVIGLAGDYLNKEYYVNQVANVIKPDVNAVIAQRANDDQLISVFTVEASKWRSIAEAERNTGLITGSAGDGQVTFAAENSALALENAVIAIQESKTAKAVFITDLNSQLTALEETARDYSGDETAVLQQIQGINTTLSALQAETPLLALKSAAEAVGQLVIAAPSNNAAFAERQAQAIIALRANARLSQQRLENAITTIEGFDVPEIRNIPSPNAVGLVWTYWRSIQMYIIAAIAIDTSPIVLIFAALVLRVPRKKVGLADVQPKRPGLAIPNAPVMPVKSNSFNQQQSGQQQQLEPTVPVQQAKPVKPEVEVPVTAPTPITAQVTAPVQTAPSVELSEKMLGIIKGLAEQDFANGKRKHASLMAVEGFNPNPVKGSQEEAIIKVYDQAWSDTENNVFGDAPKKPEAAPISNRGGPQQALEALAKQVTLAKQPETA